MQWIQMQEAVWDVLTHPILLWLADIDAGPSVLACLAGLFWLAMALFSWRFVRWRTRLADVEGAPVLLRLSALLLRLVATALCLLMAIDMAEILPAETLIASTDRVLNARLAHLGEQDITLTNILVLLTVVVVTFWGTGVVSKVSIQALSERGVDTSGTVGVLLNLGRYVLIVAGLVVALTTIGIDLTALFTLGAVFAVTIGFALQNISQNFISGIILLVEGAIRPGDILEVEGRVVRVVKMGVRSTVARSQDDEDLILPNATLAQGTVKNLTMIDDELRIKASVSVAYDSDLEAVRGILLAAARAVSDPKAKRQPAVLLQSFADSGIEFDTLMWISDPWTAPRARSDLRMSIWKAFRDEGIEIPFPQVDVHLEPSPPLRH